MATLSDLLVLCVTFDQCSVSMSGLLPFARMLDVCSLRLYLSIQDGCEVDRRRNLAPAHSSTLKGTASLSRTRLVSSRFLACGDTHVLTGLDSPWVTVVQSNHSGGKTIDTPRATFVLDMPLALGYAAETPKPLIGSWGAKFLTRLSQSHQAQRCGCAEDEALLSRAQKGR